MSFPSLRWAPGQPPPTEAEVVDYRVRTGIATVSEVRAWAGINRPLTPPFLDPRDFDPPITRPKGPPPRDERIAALEAEVAELRSRLAERGGFR